MAKKKSAQGGKAEASGADYETRVGAWYCARLLMQSLAQPLFALPTDTYINSISCQTGAAVDDVNAGTSAGGVIYAQAKRTVHLSEDPVSALVKALDQFVRQHKECEDRVSKFSPRPLDPNIDRLVLVTRRQGKKIYETLPRLLQGVRDDTTATALSDVQTSETEKEVAEAVDRVLRDRWSAAYGAPATPQQLGALLRLIWVQTLDVEDGQPDATNAQDMLRNTVLAAPTQASTAFSTLIRECARLRAERSRADTPSLHALLTAAGIGLRASPNYRSDITALNKWTDSRLQRAKRYTRLVEDTPKTTIKRDVLKKLRAAAAKDSMVLVGDPGSGKTGLAYDLAAHFRTNGQDVLFIPVEMLNAQHLSEVAKELGILHPLEEVLANWPGVGPAVLIVDALDAARSLAAQNILRDVIDSVMSLPNSRWKVVASIRRYDLRQGREWARMFRGKPPIPENIDPEFGAAKHVLVRQLSDVEIQQTAKPLPELLKLYNTATPALRTLLKNIFNLHLLAELLTFGVKRTVLSKVTTQSQLLAAYWDERIRQADGRHDAREKALLAVLDNMIAAKTLRASRATVLRSVDAGAVVELEAVDILRDEDLPGGGPADALFFTHHILFDYAVSQLIFKRGRDATGTVALLASDRHASVMLSPSLTMAFNDAWASGGDRPDFWKLALELAGDASLPAVAQLTAPAVAAELATSINDFEPLFKALRSTTPDPAIAFVSKLMGALFVKRNQGVPLVGPSAGPWMQVAETLSTFKADWAMMAIRSLLGVTYETVSSMTPQQKASIGSAARRLLDYGWSRAPRFSNFIHVGLVTTAETMESDPSASATLLRRAIGTAHLAAHGHEEMSSLCRHIKAIAEVSPDLMGEIFEAVYGYAEASDAKTNMGNSAILPLSSNRRQDYQMSWHSLSEAVPDLLRSNTVATITAIARALMAYNERENKGAGYRKRLPNTFAVPGGTRGQFREDDSHAWFRGGYKSQTDAPALVSKFEEWLSRLHIEKGAARTLSATIDGVGRNGGPAVLWSSILSLAANQPREFARAAFPIALAPQTMLSLDTRHAEGQYLSSAYPFLSKAQRRSLETAILALKGPLAGRSMEILGGSIPSQLVETTAMKVFMAAITAKKGKPAANVAPFQMTSSVTPYDTDAYFADQGVDATTPANVSLRAAERTVQALAFENDGKKVSRQLIEARLPLLEALRVAIQVARRDGADATLVEHAEALLAQSIIPITIGPAQQYDAVLRDRVAALSLFTAASPDPVFDPERERKFNNSRAWGSSTRGYTANAIINLARSDLPASSTLDAELRRLARDKVGSVRYEIIQRLPLVFEKDRNWVWSELEHVIKSDPAENNVGAAVYALAQIAYTDIKRAIALANAILTRFGKVDDDDDTGDKASSVAITLVADLALRLGDSEATTFLGDIVSHVGKYPKILGQLAARFSDGLLVGKPDDASDRDHGVRGRVLQFYTDLTDQALAKTSHIAAGRPVNQSGGWSAAEQDAYREMLMILDQIALRLQFAAGGTHNGRGGEPSAQQERLYREAAPIVSSLIKVGFPQTAHHIVQYLERFISIDPPGTFSAIAQTVQIAEGLGYGLESLAADLIVRIVGIYLADYRNVFLDPKRLDDLVNLLDVFVRAGWPAAHALTFRLGEIWR